MYHVKALFDTLPVSQSSCNSAQDTCAAIDKICIYILLKMPPSPSNHVIDSAPALGINL